MPSEFEAEFASVALAELFETFGQSVTHWPLGVEANAASVTAIWKEQEPTKSTNYGEQTERRGLLKVASSVTVSPRDKWVVESEEWQTTRATNNDAAGLKMIYVQRNDKQFTKGQRGSIR
ncbi:hypothetical protein GYB59_00565 [bacterium]|nr:hypothetical protein [bacterium]